MTFERPELLALAPVAVLLVCLAVRAQWLRAVRLADAYGGRGPSGRLAARDLRRFPASRLACLVLAAVALAGAAAGPVPSAPPPESRQPVDLVVAVDISLSMTADDVGRSRAARAAEVVGRVLEALPDERVGVAVFAGWPYTLVPMTWDLDVVRFFTPSLDPGLVADRDQGTGLAAVVTHARATLEDRRRPEASPAILVLSDGESPGDAESVIDSVAAATRDGVRLWTGGLGTRAGAALVRPGSAGEPLFDETGEPVVAGMDEALLARMADAGGGSYHDVSDEGGLAALLEDLGGETGPQAPSETPPDPALWLVLSSLLLLLWEGTADSGRRPARGAPARRDR